MQPDSLVAHATFTGNVTNSLLVTVPAGKVFTIEEVSFNTNAGDSNASLSLDCGSEKVFSVSNFSLLSSGERVRFSKCLSNLTVTTANVGGTHTTGVYLIYAPRDVGTTTVSNSIFADSNVVTYQDFMLVSMWIVFLLAIAALGFFFNNFRSRSV